MFVLHGLIKMLRKVCWSVINVVHWVWLNFDMWLNEYEYGSMASGVLRFHLNNPDTSSKDKKIIRNMLNEAKV